MICKNNVPKFKSAIEILLDKEQQINQSLQALKQCKNKTFDDLNEQLRNKTREIQSLLDNYQNLNSSHRKIINKNRQLELSLKILQEQRNEFKLAYQREKSKNESLKKQMQELARQNLETQKKYRMHIRQLDEELTVLKFNQAFSSPDRTYRSNSSNMNVSKTSVLCHTGAFDDDTAVSFHENYSIRQDT